MPVKCMLCDEELNRVTWTHLKSAHNLTLDEYSTMFPRAETISEETRNKMLGNTSSLGHSLSEEHKKSISKANLGNTYASGYSHSEESKKKISAALLGHTVSKEAKKKMSTAMTLLWKDEKYAQNVTASQHRKPNLSELQLQSVLDKHFPNTWKYTGDGTFWIEGKNPDFININGKQVIEMFGLYWHDPDLFPNRPTEKGLIAYYKQHGFDCLVVWEHEIWNGEEIVSKIKEL